MQESWADYHATGIEHTETVRMSLPTNDRNRYARLLGAVAAGDALRRPRELIESASGAPV